VPAALAQRITLSVEEGGKLAAEQGGMLSAGAFLSAAVYGHCGATEAAGDCTRTDLGSFGLDKSESNSWQDAANACLKRCSRCARCHYVTVSLSFGDCSWYSNCTGASLSGKDARFRSAAARAGLPPVRRHGVMQEAYACSITAASTLASRFHMRWQSRWQADEAPEVAQLRARVEAASRSFLQFGLAEGRAARGLFPRVIFQTWSHRRDVPGRIFWQVARYAPGYAHVIIEDAGEESSEAAEYLRRRFGGAASSEFAGVPRLYSRLVGAHKYDLLRYCLLFLHGGVYLDIETTLTQDLDAVFSPASASHTVLSAYSGTVMQGILATPRGQPLYAEAIRTMLATPMPVSHYRLFTEQFLTLVQRHTGVQRLRGGRLYPLRGDGAAPLLLQRELCISTRAGCGASSEQAAVCGGRFDKGGHCCWVARGRRGSRGNISFLVRDPQYLGQNGVWLVGWARPKAMS
jgi:hypothetical protein